MSALVLRDDSIIVLHDLAPKRERNEEWYIGREDIQSFVALPQKWVQLLLKTEMLSPATLAGMRGLFQEMSAGDPRALATVDQDVKLLLLKLVQLKFVKSVNGVPLEESTERRDLFPSVQRRHVAWFFSAPALILQALFILGGAATYAVHRELLPGLDDYFWSVHPSLTLATGMALSWLFVLIHELFHLFAARAIGISGTLRVNTRLFSIIVETDVANIFKASRPKKALVYSAGLLSNLLLLAAGAYLLSPLGQDVLPLSATATGIARQALLILALSTLWQFQFYLRTDLYGLLANALSAPNLARDASRYLETLRTGFLLRLRGESAAFPRVRRRTALFALAVAIGTPLSLAFYALTTGTILWRLLVAGAGRAATLDGASVFLLFGAMIAIFLLSRRTQTLEPRP